MEQVFEFIPNFAKLEEFLRLYQNLDKIKEPVLLILPLSESYWRTQLGYPDVEAACWISLRFAVEQMNQAFLGGSSLVKVEVRQRVSS